MTPAQTGIPDRFCTRQQLEDALRGLGVIAGMSLIVHSSLRSLGWIPGGARSVVDALLAVLGPAGTLVMPAHSGDNSDPAYWRHPPVPEIWWPAIRKAMPAFDPERTPCAGMGAIADCFRAYPGVLRSNHPTSSFLALGPAAAGLLARPDLSCSLGEDSPCGALDRADAWVLLLGVDFDRCTVMHLAEFRCACRTGFLQSSAVIGRDGREWAAYQDLDVDSDDFLSPGRELEAAGLVRRSMFSGSELRLFRVRDAVRFAGNWLRGNRMRRLGEDDRERILSYLSREPEYNLLMLGDIERFGLAAPFLDVMAFENTGGIDSIVLRYNHNFIVYSQNPAYDTVPVLAALRTPNLRFLSGKQTVLERLRPQLAGYFYRTSYLLKLTPADLPADADGRPEPPGVTLRFLTGADMPDFVDFINSISEFKRTGSRDERIGELQSALRAGLSHYYAYCQDGRIIAAAGTTAENSLSAQIISVATSPDRRGQGLASRLVTAVARDRFSCGRQYLCLMYNNPAAGRIYRRLGFRDAGDWAMATPEPSVPCQPDPVKEEEKNAL